MPPFGFLEMSCVLPVRQRKLGHSLSKMEVAATAIGALLKATGELFCCCVCSKINTTDVNLQSNLDALDMEIKNLMNRRKEVEDDKKVAEKEGYEIKAQVVKWLEDVEKLQLRVNPIQGDFILNKKPFTSFLNCKVEETLNDIKSLLEDGSFDSIRKHIPVLSIEGKLNNGSTGVGGVGKRSVPKNLNNIHPMRSASFDPNLRISMEELVVATNNFSTDLIIDDGSFGLVYKAKLSNGVTVAIKKLDPDAFQGFREFRAEMEILSKLHHPNIVKILGYCMSGSVRLLIYEFMQKGSLDQWLRQEQDAYSLSWGTRIQIIKDVANGLSFLHGLEKPIIHRDIKASNVLLDSDFQAHIADFGLARQIDNSKSHVSTVTAGTKGYMPPEYKKGLVGATVEGDVYSFGILMLAIATGKHPNLPILLDGEEVELLHWAQQLMEQNQHMEMVDHRILREDGLIEVQVKQYFEIAHMCTREKRRERPAMAKLSPALHSTGNHEFWYCSRSRLVHNSSRTTGSNQNMLEIKKYGGKANGHVHSSPKRTQGVAPTAQTREEATLLMLI
uniref:Protein kinase domain-containing protein n=1 Tax=Fagus sylvatica TaxID=28930 RepID=A0A2N9F2T7_FAGSY